MAKMTKKEREQHIAALEAAIKKEYTLDRWGKYRREDNGITTRIEIGKVNLKIQVRKPGKEWFTVHSKPLSATTLECLKKHLSNVSKKAEPKKAEPKKAEPKKAEPSIEENEIVKALQARIKNPEAFGEHEAEIGLLARQIWKKAAQKEKSCYGHFVNSMAGQIDKLVKEGKHSVDEIVAIIDGLFPNKETRKVVNKVNSHIRYLVREKGIDIAINKNKKIVVK